MALLHIVKLSAATESVEHYRNRVADWMRRMEAAGHAPECLHQTRMQPSRTAELEGGSVYWVIKGSIQCRQRLLGVRPFTDPEGVSRCWLVLDPEVTETEWRPRRAFQGWRYLKPEDAPPDLGSGDAGGMPEDMRRELAGLGLI